MYVANKSKQNPIIIRDQNKYFESFAVFNMSVVKKGKNFFGFYRAISGVDPMTSPSQISSISITESLDGINFKNRKQFIVGEEDWEKYGVEDPRAVYFEGKYYIFYTALSAYPPNKDSIKVGLAISKDLKKIDQKHLITPFNAKAMTIFPKRINGKIVAIFSKNTDNPPAEMHLIEFDEMKDLWDPTFWDKFEKKPKKILNLKRDQYDHVEVGATPLLTKYGWLFVYSHIQYYFENPNHFEKIFGIESVLLDLKNPAKIIGRTRGPIIVPEEEYELKGFVPNVVFPSGALLEKDNLNIYYGGADTCICIATVSMSDLLGTMRKETEEDFHFKRFKKNPILAPRAGKAWEAKGTFNPAAVYLKNKTYILYRAFSSENTSTLGYAISKNGFDILERGEEPIYLPRENFEKKINEGNFSGCEDPRLTQIGDKVYMCYTAYDGVHLPKVAITSISEKDLISKNWNWSKPFLITPNDYDDKDTCILPNKFKAGYFVLHRVNHVICGAYISSIDEPSDLVKKCIGILKPRINKWDSWKVGIASPPIKTIYGWLLLYHGVSKSHATYRVGAVLLDLNDPAIVLARSTDPIFEPREDYEKNGIVNNVVFPCGVVLQKDTLFIYYGGADYVVGVATMKLDVVLNSLVKSLKF